MDFDRWMRQQAPAAVAPEADKAAHAQYVEALLEADVLREGDAGGYLALCCKCDRWTELYCGPEEVDVDYEHYCGGSPYCCP